jgi:uracil-DNA glycosylase family 4
MPGTTMDWIKIEEEIKQCMKCKEEGLSGVRCPDGRIPFLKPRNVKLLFVSEAPPLNCNSYFYNEKSNDRLRTSLFELLRNELGYEMTTLTDFSNAGFFLLPTVKCPSAREGRNTAPATSVIRRCAEHHLKREIEYIKPDGVCLLGRTALHGFFILHALWDEHAQNSEELGRTLSAATGKVLEVRMLDKTIKFMISYWPTRRHRKFHKIAEHIGQLMEEIHF